MDTLVAEEVALKYVRADRSSAETIENLWREANQSRRLTHSNIARVYDVCEFEGEDGFIVMEFIDGQPLSVMRAMNPQGYYSWESMIPLVVQLCEALEYAHGQGIVHRDIKPANLMVTRNGVLKLTDFGLAAQHDSEGARGGSPPYMSPQQLRGLRPTIADDVYSVGAVIYELLSGRPPFFRGDIEHQIRHQMPEPLDERMADMGLEERPPPAVGALVMACLSKDPQSRPEGVATIREWLNLPHRGANDEKSNRTELAESEVPEASIGDGEPIWRRRRFAFAGVGGLILVLAAGYLLTR